jgi:hypothetical protein
MGYEIRLIAHFLFGVVSGVANEGQIRLNFFLPVIEWPRSLSKGFDMSTTNLAEAQKKKLTTEWVLWR